MKRGVGRAVPDAEVVEIPLADGGEGTLDALLLGAGGKRKTARVRGPLDEEIDADWGILPDGTAVIELASAAGLNLSPPDQRDAGRASTYGVGQLISAAINVGARRFLVGLGGSATTDGATGLMSALGVRFYDERDCVLPPGGGELARLARIEMKFLDWRFPNCRFTALCDVTNPLCGDNGAAAVFGPQKGATPAQVAQLDAGLARLAEVTAAQFGRDFSLEPGAGAAGGAGFGLMAFGGATLRSGIDAVLEATGFGERIAGADLILTGEGSLDAQTLNGKTISGVCRVATDAGVPVVALGGRVALSGGQLDALGLRSAFSIVDGPRALASCLAEGAALVETASERVLRLWMRP